MADLDNIRQTLLTCLWDSLPRYTPDGLPTVLDPHSGEGIWHDAILPYNLRLADSVGPLALVYRKSQPPNVLPSVDVLIKQPRRPRRLVRPCNAQ